MKLPTMSLHTIVGTMSILIAVILLAVFIAYIVRSSGSAVSQVPPTRIPVFRSIPCVMNRSEAAFYHELRRQLPNGYYIFPKMRIADFISAVDGRGFYQRRNYILPKHIDFLVCDSYF